MLISLVNFTKIPDADLQTVVRAINRQIAEDFEPVWNWSARVRLEGRAGAKPSSTERFPEELRGDAIMYLATKVDSDGVLGFHDKNFAGLPFGFVSTELSEKLDEAWTVTLSHETLELVGDASSNCYAAGPHPKDAKRTVMHWYEMCDAVQDESYSIDGIQVSNFVLPLYFTPGDERGGRNDFLGTLTKAGTRLASFGTNPGGYIGFFDPKTGKDSTFELPGDKRAAERQRIKDEIGLARRSTRRKLLLAPPKR